MLSLTTSKFAIFTKGKRNLSWFEGREFVPDRRNCFGIIANGDSGLLQDLEAGYNLSLDKDNGPGEFPFPPQQSRDSLTEGRNRSYKG
jgi:salicylate hydroxylase